MASVSNFNTDIVECGRGSTDFSSDETDLSYCGKASEEKHLTYDEATVKYDSECNICPDNASCETINYQKPGTDLTVTCWTDDGEAVIDDTYVIFLDPAKSWNTLGYKHEAHILQNLGEDHR